MGGNTFLGLIQLVDVLLAELGVYIEGKLGGGEAVPKTGGGGCGRIVIL